MIIDETVLLDYIMGSLTPDQERAVVAYLNAHPDEAAWVRDMFEATAEIALSLPPEPLAADAGDALLARVRQTTAPSGTAPSNTGEKAVGAQPDTFGDGFDDSFGEDSLGFDISSFDDEVDADSSGGEPFNPDNFDPDNFNPGTVRVPEQLVESTLDDDFDGYISAESEVIQLEPRRSTLRLVMTTALAASLLALGWLGFREPLANYQIGQRLNRTCAGAGVSCELISGDGADIGTLVKLSDTQLVMVFNSDPPEGQVYQAWEIADTPVSLGVWQQRVLELPRPLSAGSTFGVTVEPAGGSPQPTSTPVVAVPLGG